ncbi:hypothetical protein C8Q78DRAFT_989392 [Trametes maxima]|nr:hypothetical protein C8Q78DRAFT_989392 [Trametes maxima]
MATKNLSFKSVNLGEDVTLLLCFTPPSPDLFIKQFPVAWKVTTLSAVGHSGIDATWTSTLGFCMPQIGGGQRIVSASNYTHMKVGDVTTLTVNNAVNPPVYFFTPPIARPGVDSIQAINNVGHPATIALGFITDPDTPNEVMNPVLTWTDVGNGLAVTGEFTPVLRAYVALKYQASEILRGEVQGVKPIWEANLLSLGPHTTIIVSKDATGAFVGKKLGGNAKDAPLLKVPSGFPDGKSRVYKADLAFSTPKIALQAARAIGDQLFGKSYLTKFIYKEGAAEARIELSLPCGVSCHQAERDMVSALEGEPFIGHHAQIKGHGGQILLSTEGSFSYWSDINPATIAWYITGKGNAITRSADESEIDFEDGEPGDAVTVNGSPNLLGPGNYNGRTISRKASTASLAA